jgi:O-antigen ligase
MESAVRQSRVVGATRVLPGPSVEGIGAWLLGFGLVAYLALSGGGYDSIVRGEIGIAVWWLALAGVATGVLTLRWRPAGLGAAGLLGALTLLTALALAWTTSAESTVAEVGRTATHLGVLVLALSALAGRPAAPALHGVATAVGLVAVLAATSRLQPQWFPENDQTTLLADAAHRLSYPLNYWNGLAAFVAMGIPALLAAATGARSRVAQAAAAAVVPFAALTISLTASRGGVLALGVAVAAYLVLTSDRLAALAAIAVGAAGSAVVLAALARRDVLTEALTRRTEQGDDMLLIAVLAAAGCALLQVAVGLVMRHATRPAWTVVPPRRTAQLTAAGALVAVLAAVALGVPGQLGDRWEEFKSPSSASGSLAPGASPGGLFDRLDSTAGNGRYQVWQSALDAMQTDPLKGIGPGTFESWWLREATVPSYVRDAHSVVFETLAELGIPGLLLTGGLLVLLLVAGAARTLRAQPESRARLAAATAGVAAFAASAAIDWSWELFVLPATAMILGAIAVAGSRSDWRDDPPPAPVRGSVRAAWAALCLVAIVAVAIPLAGTSAVRSSQDSARAGDLPGALREARTAERTQPYAATAIVQEALVLELAGDLTAARAAIRRATVREPGNWRAWVVRSRLEARSGDAEASVDSYRRARALNPRSPLLR